MESPAVPFELQSLADAVRYQHWLKDAVSPFLGRRLLELGSGIGNLSQHLPVRERLILSDIDPELLKILRAKMPETDKISVLQATTTEPLSARLRGENLDTVVSFNVLEHVEDDGALLRDMISLLRESKAPGAKAIVSLVPAHQWAFGTIDEKFGHFRRYSVGSFKASLARAGVNKLDRSNFHARYLNLPGLLGWWVTGRLLKKREIGDGNMRLFEKLCPVIRPLDEFLHRGLRFPAGNSLLAVYWVSRE